MVAFCSHLFPPIMYKLHTVFTDLNTHMLTLKSPVFKTHREAERTYQYIYIYKAFSDREKAVTEYTIILIMSLLQFVSREQFLFALNQKKNPQM